MYGLMCLEQFRMLAFSAEWSHDSFMRAAQASGTRLISDLPHEKSFVALLTDNELETYMFNNFCTSTVFWASGRLH